MCGLARGQEWGCRRACWHVNAEKYLLEMNIYYWEYKAECLYSRQLVWIFFFSILFFQVFDTSWCMISDTIQNLFWTRDLHECQLHCLDSWQTNQVQSLSHWCLNLANNPGWISSSHMKCWHILQITHQSHSSPYRKRKRKRREEKRDIPWSPHSQPQSSLPSQ